MNALIWNKGRWSLHLFPLSQTNRRLVDAAQARFLRRLTKIPAAFYSHVSHAQVRKRCFSTPRFSTFIFRAQLRWLGHILRKPRSDPLHRILFEPRTNFAPVNPPSPFPNRPAKKKVGRPHLDWAQTLFSSKFLQKFTVCLAPIEQLWPGWPKTADFFKHLSSAYVSCLIVPNFPFFKLFFSEIRLTWLTNERTNGTRCIFKAETLSA